MKLIKLTQDKWAMVDDEDYDWLMQWKWHAAQRRGNLWYAARISKSTEMPPHRCVLMHRVILRSKKGSISDHIDHNGLHNCKANLRQCSHAQNMHNCRLQKRNTCGYKGVSWDNTRNKWHAHITYNGRLIALGRFTCLVRAARAYDAKATELFGEFAQFNFPMAALSQERGIE